MCSANLLATIDFHVGSSYKRRSNEVTAAAHSKLSLFTQTQNYLLLLRQQTVPDRALALIGQYEQLLQLSGIIQILHTPV